MVRKREPIHATWDEVDFDNAVWTIPPERMKRRHGHVIPLSRQALEAFRELQPIVERLGLIANICNLVFEYRFQSFRALPSPVSCRKQRNRFPRVFSDRT